MTISNTRGVEVTIGSTVYYNNFAFDSKKTALTLGGAYTGTLKSADYYSRTKVVNATRLTAGTNISGNTMANSIFGGSGNDTLAGSSGNDTLTGGAGRDVFIYSSGKDVITDFENGTDSLQINGTITGASLKRSDLAFTVQGGGTVTLKETKDAEVTVAGAIYYNNIVYDLSKTTATLGSGVSGTVKADDYAGTVKNIDGSGIAKKLRIEGNALDNSITGGSGNNTLAGGSGNDTLTGGDGKDVFVFSEGADVVTG